ncbi:S41 family peptidase [Agromyces binzhouensis]|uniref:S41 family peptidase n=1 Tax=Agromyces binzhouensis TaxID=1817495 RepID=UPI00362BAFE1
MGLAALLALTVSGCAPSAEVSVRNYVDQAITGLDEGYYADSPEWHAAVAEALPDLYSAKNIPGTYRLLSSLTKVAGGAHSFFSTPADVAAWEQRYPPGHVPVPTVSYDGSVATVVVPGFSSAHQDEADLYLEAAAEIFTSPRARSTCGWVIYASANTGGDLRVMLVALSPLLDDGVVAVFRERDGSTTEVVVHANSVSWRDEVWGELPAEPTKLASRPIAIVQSGATASAGESVIIAFTGQEAVRTFGSATGGFTTVNDGFELPDGAAVTLSFAVMGDREGNFHEGPLAPDREGGHGDGSSQAVARDWVAGHCPDS